MQSTTELAWYASVLDGRYRGLEGEALLRPLIEREFEGRIALLSSFGAEAALLLHMVAQIDPAVPVIFLDTGKLFGETLRYRDALVARLGLTDLRIVTPDPADLAQRDPQGTLWHRDADACCRLRKVEPLERALASFGATIAGRKRYQGGARRALRSIEAIDGRIQVNPLAAFTRERIEREFAGAQPAAASARSRRLPVDRLHALHRPRRHGRGSPRRALARLGEGRMRHPPRVAARRGRVRHERSRRARKPKRLHLARGLPQVREARPCCGRSARTSNVLVWLARKAFFGHVPFPVVHIDTAYKLPEMIAFRERMRARMGPRAHRRAEPRRAGRRHEPHARPRRLLLGAQDRRA